VDADLDDADAFQPLVGNERVRRSGQEHLAAMAGRADPRAANDT